MSSRRLRRRGLSALASAVVAAIAACTSGGDGVSVTPAASLRVTGRLERGQWVHLALLGPTDVPVTATVVNWSVVPPAAATLSGDSAQLQQAGLLTVRGAALVGADSLRGTASVTIAAPPQIVFYAVRDSAGVGNRDVYAVALDGFDFVRLTTDPTDDREPSGRNGTVVFVSTRSGSKEIWRVPIGGGVATRITTNATDESAPRLSPSGAQIAYIDFNGGLPRLRIMNVDGSNDVRFAAADPAAVSIEGWPAWSPTGDRIAYATTRDGNTAIYVGPVAGGSGSATRAVGGAGTGNNVEPSWSPDGSRIVFASNRLGPTDLFVVTVATGVTTQLTTRGSVGRPCWLADGRIVFNEFVLGEQKLRWMDPADTSRVVPINVGAGGGEQPQQGR